MHAEAATQSYKTSRIVKEGCAIGKQNVEKLTQIRNAKNKEAVCILSVFLQSERKGCSKFNLVSRNFMFLVLIASTSDDFPNLLNSPSVTSSMAKVLPQCHHYIQTSRAHFLISFGVVILLV
jgi:putative heme iron utilization protein